MIFNKYNDKSNKFNEEYEIWLDNLNESKKDEIEELERNYNKCFQTGLLALIPLLGIVAGMIIACIGSNNIAMVALGIVIASSSVGVIFLIHRKRPNANIYGNKIIKQELDKNFKTYEFDRYPIIDKEEANYISNIFYGFKELPIKGRAEDRINGLYKNIHFEFKELDLIRNAKNDTHISNGSLLGISKNRKLQRALKKGPSNLIFVDSAKINKFTTQTKANHKNYDNDLFSGIMLTIDIPLNIKYNIYFVRKWKNILINDSSLLGKLMNNNSNYKDGIQTESTEFNNSFAVYCEDEHSAFKILTPVVIDTLYEAFIQQFDKNLNAMNVSYFAFTNDNKMHIFFKTDKDFIGNTNTAAVRIGKSKYNELFNNPARDLAYNINKQILTIKASIDSMVYIANLIDRS